MVKLVLGQDYAHNELFWFIADTQRLCMPKQEFLIRRVSRV